MRQVYNQPLDLFIEDFLYREYPEARPLQFLSLLKLLREATEAVRNKQALEFSPPAVHKASMVLNLVMALQFRDLFGYDALPDFMLRQPVFHLQLWQGKSFGNRECEEVGCKNSWCTSCRNFLYQRRHRKQ